MPPHTDLYAQDFYAWTQQQAALLREGKVHALDLPNLAEEKAHSFASWCIH